jgi:hypothetical protein
VDSNGKLQILPFPPSDVAPGKIRGINTLTSTDIVYGVELMVNPSSLSSNLAKLIGRSQTMTSYVEDHWGEELDTLTIQGHTAAFVTGASGPSGDIGDIYSLRLSTQEQTPINEFVKKYKNVSSGRPGVGISDTDPGLTVSQRRKSMSYIQFRRLLDIIRINGCLFDYSGLVRKRYYIMLSYGNSAYKGFFENVDVTEIATDPFRYQYTITFKSEETLYSYVNQGISNVYVPPPYVPPPKTVVEGVSTTNQGETSTYV